MNMLDDPLDNWLTMSEMLPAQGASQRTLRKMGISLDKLEAALSILPDGKPHLTSLIPPLAELTPISLASAERERVQQLAMQFAQRSSKDTKRVEAVLLNAIGFTQAPESIPFWQSLLNLKQSHDRFAATRGRFALSALALLAINQENQIAYAALESALQHPTKAVRADAAYYLGGAYAIPNRPIPDHVVEVLTTCATADPVFEARYQARMTLRYLQLPIPLDNPGGVYLFKVQLKGDESGATRTIALQPEQTLSTLHFAIQDAFDWDADHLYSFYLRGKRYDQEYEISGPDGDPFFGEMLGGALELFPTEAAEIMKLAEQLEEEAANEADGALDTTNTVLGQIGMKVKHKLLYYFDFGDSHQFEVTLVKIEAQADQGEYPRVVEAHGEAPPQYYGEDEEEDW